MDDDDDVFLKSLNTTDASTQCSEEHFEEVVNFYEETAQAKQPFAAVDSTPVLPYEEIENAFAENLDAPSRLFVHEIYQHWKSRRLKTGNKPLGTSLKASRSSRLILTLLTFPKVETGAETDEVDPYVCFRRREVRQIRKTRGRDAHSAEKLKKLRKELEESRQIMALIRQREITKREQLTIERQLFEQRDNLRQIKRNLPEQYREGDEELLINQKPQKKKPFELTNQRTPGTQLRMPQRPDGRFAEVDLIQLHDVLAENERQVQEEIDMRIAQHKKRSEGYLDVTRAPLTPPLEQSTGSSFRTATTEYLPTPPASISSEHSGDVAAEINSPTHLKDETVAVRYASPSYDAPGGSQPSFRRRIGRGGRLMIDRRGMRVPWKEGSDDVVADRYRFDHEDDDDEIPTYQIDPYSISSMRHRAKIPSLHLGHQAQALRRQQREASISSGLGSTNSSRPQNSSRTSGAD